VEFKTRLTEVYIDKYTKAGFWINKTLAEYLDEAIKECPDKDAVVDRDRRITYRQLGQMVDRMALGLLELGVKSGDVVAFQLPSWLEAVVIHHAVAKIGAITLPIIPIYRHREIKYILEHSESKVLIIPREFRKFNYVQMIDELRNDLPALKHIFVVGGGELPTGMSSFEQFMSTRWEERRSSQSLKSIKLDPNAVMLLMFTSGTEADPKGVLHNTNTLLHEVRSLVTSCRLGEDDVIFIPTPVTHITGLLYGLEMPQMLKAKLVLMDIWDADKAIELIEKEKCSFTLGATPFLLGIARSPILAQHDVSSIKMFACGGAECSPSAIRYYIDRIPTSRAARGYGSTEYPTVGVNLIDSPLDKASERDGKPVMGTEVKIVDEDCTEVPVGTSGEFLVRGPECFIGYLDPALNKKYFTEDGWFHTGDLGRLDEDGYVEVTGRKKDVIIRGGENISAKEVEDILYTHPDIAAVAVVAMPDPKMQEKVCAYVVLKAGKALTFDELSAFLKTKDLAKQKWPERLEIVDELPMTASGKIQKYVLRQDIRKKLGYEPK
jgi:cyclohexanecarboxylate-CoA ligase